MLHNWGFWPILLSLLFCAHPLTQTRENSERLHFRTHFENSRTLWRKLNEWIDLSPNICTVQHLIYLHLHQLQSLPKTPQVVLKTHPFPWPRVLLTLLSPVKFPGASYSIPDVLLTSYPGKSDSISSSFFLRFKSCDTICFLSFVDCIGSGYLVPQDSS